MTTNYHTPHATNAPLTSAGLNTPLGTLDAQVTLLSGMLVSVLAYGAVPDDTTDCTTAFSTAIAAAGPGGVVIVPGDDLPYKITDTLTISDDNVTIMSLGGATIRQATSGKGGLLITGDNCRVEGLVLKGPQFASSVSGEQAIEFRGTDASTILTRGVVERCTLHSWGRYGVIAQFARDISVLDSKIYDIYYAGVIYYSIQRGEVSRNTIRNIVGTPNAYGVTLTRSNGSLATYPRTTDITVSGNVVVDVVNWEGLDTHGGERIVFSGNTIEGCQTGITVTDGEDAANDPSFGALDCIVVGNTMDSGVTDGSASTGIAFAGAIITTGSPIGKATGVIANNVIRGFGTDNTATGTGAIMVHTTQGLSIVGNTIIEPGQCGINIYHDNYEFVCVGNSIVDPWNDAGSGIVCAIGVRSTYNRGVISGNIGSKDAKSAAAVMTQGIRLASDAANSLIHLGTNYMEEATTRLSDAGSDSRIRLEATKIGFFSTAPIAKPTVTGSRGGNAALASALTQLAALGLITDSSS